MISLLSICEWLAATPASIALRESRYVFLIVLTLHVLSLAVAVGTAVMVDLRLLGLTMPRVPASEVVSRLVPWAGWGFLIVIVSGLLLFYASPVDRYGNLFFRAKMAMLVLAGVNAWLFHKGTAYRGIAAWDRAARPPGSVRLSGGIALFLWAGIILAGRLIAYESYWFG